MEAAGIEEDQRTPAHQAAIISMIYTDEGQQQMVNWVKNGIFPPHLLKVGFKADNVYLDGGLIKFLENISVTAKKLEAHKSQQEALRFPVISQVLYTFRDSTIGALFPCVTGTFSSFSANPSRLGYQILNHSQMLPQICASLLCPSERINSFLPEIQKILLPLISTSSLDCQLAKLLFVIDICDSKIMLYDILDNCGKECPRHFLDEEIAKRSYDEYDHVPVSATALPNDRNGDCVENMCRHLIAWAVQGRAEHEVKDTVLENGLYQHVTVGKSGVMDLLFHKSWKDALSRKIMETFNVRGRKEQEQLLKNIYTGSIENIARILYSALNTKPPVSETVFNKDTITRVLCSFAGVPITVDISDAEIGAPTGTTQVLTITNQTARKQIKLAICINGHAEIFKINVNLR